MQSENKGKTSLRTEIKLKEGTRGTCKVKMTTVDRSTHSIEQMQEQWPLNHMARGLWLRMGGDGSVRPFGDVGSGSWSPSRSLSFDLSFLPNPSIGADKLSLRVARRMLVLAMLAAFDALASDGTLSPCADFGRPVMPDFPVFPVLGLDIPLNKPAPPFIWCTVWPLVTGIK